ncbi:ribosomal protein L15 [Ferroglobus placidus DSM 10642]|uniref:Large ribosomal subunit protein eL18 n=1 Tax=Ferroglobus placidus (strain DSM 10642 / AEDII12DO) TaxID=589924 RepID=D3S039_FERPA|nr:50S ribosomal protein L18e [Ferroglobus placidus]ADC66102.1 ribosomal protein L15 [Ferroglobus placidus DSM 10642]
MSKIRKVVRRKTNPNLVRLIDTLLKASAENKAKIWKDVAERLAKPTKHMAEVNVGKIERHLKDNEIALIPGKVLGAGEISRAVKVAAFKFSESAKRKIEEAGGRCMSIEELIKENPKGSNVRILV